MIKILSNKYLPTLPSDFLDLSNYYDYKLTESIKNNRKLLKILKKKKKTTIIMGI